MPKKKKKRARMKGVLGFGKTSFQGDPCREKRVSDLALQSSAGDVFCCAFAMHYAAASANDLCSPHLFVREILLFRRPARETFFLAYGQGVAGNYRPVRSSESARSGKPCHQPAKACRAGPKGWPAPCRSMDRCKLPWRERIPYVWVVPLC